jgi:FKBP-type peptidyl-prolyl cis-trans isomerase FklB
MRGKRGQVVRFRGNDGGRIEPSAIDRAGSTGYFGCKTDCLFPANQENTRSHFDDMKKILLPLLCFTAASVLADGTNQFASDSEREAYALGQNMGSNLKRNDVDVDIGTFMRGLKDGLAGTPALSDAEVRATFQQLQGDIRVNHKAKNEAFLAANKSKPGVITLADGLQYQVITTGNGATPSATDTVAVNYRGTLIDGTEFDSSYKRGQPAQFEVDHVIPGWTEALQKMTVGSKWKLFIPSNLAYGERGSQPSIAPSSTLVFEVELVSVQATPPPPPAPAPAPAAPPLTSDIIKVPSKAEMDKGAKIEQIKQEDMAKYMSNAPAAGK